MSREIYSLGATASAANIVRPGVPEAASSDDTITRNLERRLLDAAHDLTLIVSRLSIITQRLLPEGLNVALPPLAGHETVDKFGNATERMDAGLGLVRERIEILYTQTTSLERL